jgi:hypothetical protein
MPTHQKHSVSTAPVPQSSIMLGVWSAPWGRLGIIRNNHSVQADEFFSGSVSAKIRAVADHPQVEADKTEVVRLLGSRRRTGRVQQERVR